MQPPPLEEGESRGASKESKGSDEDGESFPTPGRTIPAPLRPPATGQSAPVAFNTLTRARGSAHSVYIGRGGAGNATSASVVEDVIEGPCPSGCPHDSVYRFAVVHPELTRIKRGTYWTFDVCIAMVMLVMTAICQVCIVDIAGGYIIQVSYKQFQSSIRQNSDLPLVDSTWEFVKEPIYGPEEEKECCRGQACSAAAPCCRPEGSGGNGTEQNELKPQRLDSICIESKDLLDCAPPTFQLIGRWDTLDLDGDLHWSREEAAADVANLGCRLQLSQTEIFKTVCAGIVADNGVKRALGLTVAQVPPEIRSMAAVSREYYQLWEGIATVCSVADAAKCGMLVGQGVFDGVLGTPANTGTWDLSKSLEYCAKLLIPGGVCDATLPVTFALHRQSTSTRCGLGIMSAGSLYVNPHDDMDSVRPVSVRYKKIDEYELVHSFRFKFFVWIMLILWLVTLNKELQSVLVMVNFATYYPSNHDVSAFRTLRSVSWRDIKSAISETTKYGTASEPLIIGSNTRVVICDISDAHRFTCWCVLILRVFNLTYMLAVGVVYACCTFSYLDLLMNTVALGFVFELPELFYTWLVPDHIKEQLNRTDLAPFDSPMAKTGDLFPVVDSFARSKLAHGLLIIPVACFIIVEGNDRFHIMPMLDALRCACAQSGDRCLVGQHLTSAWWNLYWERVKHLITTG